MIGGTEACGHLVGPPPLPGVEPRGQRLGDLAAGLAHVTIVAYLGLALHLSGIREPPEFGSTKVRDASTDLDAHSAAIADVVAQVVLARLGCSSWVSVSVPLNPTDR